MSGDETQIAGSTVQQLLLPLHGVELDPYPAEVLAALAVAQLEIFNPCKNREVSVESRTGGRSFSYEYAELNVVTEIIRQPCAKNGLSVMQTVTRDDKDRPSVLTILGHMSGKVIKFYYPLYVTESEKMKKDQCFASAYTYAKRQALKGIFAIADDTEDHDGQGDNDDATIVKKAKAAAASGKKRYGGEGLDPNDPDMQFDKPTGKTTSKSDVKTEPKRDAAALVEMCRGAGYSSVELNFLVTKFTKKTDYTKTTPAELDFIWDVVSKTNVAKVKEEIAVAAKVAEAKGAKP